MPQKPKDEDPAAEHEKDAPEEASWNEDRKNRGYYYDDAHGYEVYVPDEDDEEAA